MARGDAESCHRADRGQRLAAKPERANPQQILVVELGGGVAIHRQRQIARVHAAAVVGDADPPPSAAIGEDVDPAGAGVDGVLHQLLDHARRSLDHFAGGDAVDDLFGELADGHGAGRLGGGGSPNLGAFAGWREGGAANTPPFRQLSPLFTAKPVRDEQGWCPRRRRFPRSDRNECFKKARLRKGMGRARAPDLPHLHLHGGNIVSRADWVYRLEKS